MSTEIDWSKAPEGATHWHPAAASWVKIEGEEIMLWLTQDGENFWGKKSFYFPSYPISISSLFPAPGYWDGEGIPAVGSVCEARLGREWVKVKIFAVRDSDTPGKQDVLYEYEYDGKARWSFTCSDHLFRPIRTPEQIAAEDREREIEALAADIMYEQHKPWRVIAERLHALGYRKVEGGAE